MKIGYIQEINLELNPNLTERSRQMCNHIINQLRTNYIKSKLIDRIEQLYDLYNTTDSTKVKGQVLVEIEILESKLNKLT